MRGVERIQQPDPLTASVFAQMQSIVGEEPVARQASVLRHVSVEEAMRELLQMQNSIDQCAPSASQ